MGKKKGNFVRDLACGNRGQALLIALLHGCNIEVVSENKSKAYDLTVKYENKVRTIEVKYDVYASRSGNIAIEYYNPKSCVDSGIMATEADFWVHIITNPVTLWITSVISLKEFVSKTTPHKNITCGGDDNAALYLYKKSDILGTEFNELKDCNAIQLIFGGK